MCLTRRSIALVATVLGSLALRPAAWAERDGACSSATVTLTVTWDQARAATLSGLVARLRYPASLDLPVDPETGSASARVENRSGRTGGLFEALPTRNGGASDTSINIGLIGRGIAVGEFARVRFDCRPGSRVPPASAFTCSTDAADEAGPIAAACAVAVSAD